jgi:hypothetical protein
MNGFRGVTWWTALAVTMAVALLGAVVDLQVNHQLGLLFDIAFVVGTLAAVLLVRRDGLFVPMVAPPPILVLTLAVTMLVAGIAAGSSMSSTVLGIGVPLLTSFPTMAIATALALLVGVTRMLRDRRARQPLAR